MKPHFLKLSTTSLLILGTVFIICSSPKIIPIDDAYALENYIKYDDFIYDDSIKTVLLHNVNAQMSYPIFSLNGNQGVKLSFDDLRRENSIYNYTVIHCDANWEKSDLEQNEYIEGFFEDELFDFEYSSNEFELTTGPDQVILTCNNTLIDKVEYQSYRPGPASDSRGLQVEPNSLNSVANDNIKNWCYTGLPILSEQYLYANNKVASPGQPNPNCALISLPYMFINDQQKVLIEGIDFEQTLQIAAEELTRNYATAELTIWAIRDQIITKEIAKTISTLYFKHIDGLYDSEPFTMIDWNHGVWHFAWAIANLYRNGDDAIKAELQLAYEDAIKRPQTLDKYELAAIDNVLSHEVLMGDAHDMGHAFAQGHIVVPGNPDYVQSYQAYHWSYIAAGPLARPHANVCAHRNAFRYHQRVQYPWSVHLHQPYDPRSASAPQR